MPFPGVRIQAHRLTIGAEEREESTGGVFPPPDAASDAGFATWVWQGEDAGVAGEGEVEGHFASFPHRFMAALPDRSQVPLPSIRSL